VRGRSSRTRASSERFRSLASLEAADSRIVSKRDEPTVFARRRRRARCVSSHKLGGAFNSIVSLTLFASKVRRELERVRLICVPNTPDEAAREEKKTS
jgi:hypothetical protein